MAATSTRAESPILDENIDSIPYHTTYAARNYIQPRWNEYRNNIQKMIQGSASYQKQQRKTVNWLAWSCDGKKLASCGYEKVVRIWTPERTMEITGRSTASLSGGHTEHIDQVVWNPVHKDLLCSSSSEDRRVCFWDARQSKVIQNIRLEGSPWQISFSPDGKTLLGNDNSRTIFMFQQEKREEDGKDSWVRLEAPKHSLDNTSIMDVAWLNSNNQLGISCTDGSIRIFDYPSLKELHMEQCHGGQCNTLDVHPRGNYIATGGNDAILAVWDTREWMCVRTCSPSDDSVNWLRFSSDGEWIAMVMDKQKEITFVNFEMGEVGYRLKTNGEVHCLAWHPSKLILASCGDQETQVGGWVSLFAPPS